LATIAFDNVSKQFEDGTVAVDGLDLAVAEGEFLILVGPSGCGKTTALRMVAGLEEVTKGAIRIGTRDVTHLPPVERDIAMVFQNYALYPHMSVEDNILFPLRQKGVKKAEARERAQEVARLLSIEDLLHRKPRALSGGQRQRVAIGRALVRRPLAFLMDEPLSNLDAKLRVQMRGELLSLHRQVDITTVYVTHDQTEAMTLGDRVVVMNKGVVQQVATPDELYRHPANTFVAGFIGSPSMNFVRGTVDGGSLTIGTRSFPLSDGQRARLGQRGGELIVGVRPESFVAANGAGGFPARVEFVESLGPESLVHFVAEGLDAVPVQTDAAEAGLLVARFGADASYAPDTRAELDIDASHVSLFDPADGRAVA
jgi:multiple sugar transport system ATP-binding protein